MSNIIPTINTTRYIHSEKFQPLKGIQWSCIQS